MNVSVCVFNVEMKEASSGELIHMLGDMVEHLRAS